MSTTVFVVIVFVELIVKLITFLFHTLSPSKKRAYLYSALKNGVFSVLFILTSGFDINLGLFFLFKMRILFQGHKSFPAGVIH